MGEKWNIIAAWMVEPIVWLGTRAEIREVNKRLEREKEHDRVMRLYSHLAHTTVAPSRCIYGRRLVEGNRRIQHISH